MMADQSTHSCFRTLYTCIGFMSITDFVEPIYPFWTARPRKPPRRHLSVIHTSPIRSFERCGDAFVANIFVSPTRHPKRRYCSLTDSDTDICSTRTSETIFKYTRHFVCLESQSCPDRRVEGDSTVGRHQQLWEAQVTNLERHVLALSRLSRIITNLYKSFPDLLTPL
ncbi:hypothetical protein EDD18DRAFT_858018 [Armillaria luteobubalina]|uniref:Uncharacterized protein n=1 Tax=Armillaria luteobubalina TaxID=153913 RepID=A0AA39TSR8_9AGAR|nr:hypothetical protein EDD18DRAFT_858018 [Armillaria luteobubalina]